MNANKLYADMSARERSACERVAEAIFARAEAYTMDFSPAKTSETRERAADSWLAAAIFTKESPARFFLKDSQ